MNNKINGSKKKILLVISIIMFGLLLVGGTYAAIMLSLNIIVTNGVYNYTTQCFDINYNYGEVVKGVLVPSSAPSGGILADVSVSISSECDVSGLGSVSLNVKQMDSILGSTVVAHCENSTTLVTMDDYTTSDDCLSANGKWVTNGTALKYAFYSDLGSNPIKTGYVTSSGNIDLISDFSISHTNVNYYLYVWLDGNISDNSYIQKEFDGEIDVEVVQLPSDIPIEYAVYSATDNSLTFYNTTENIKVNDTYNGKTVTAVYTNFKHSSYNSSNLSPWYEYSDSIVSVSVAHELSPTSLGGWFYGLKNVTSFDLVKLNTSNVSDMSGLFYEAGINVSSFSINGLSNWNVSGVKNMYTMFYKAGRGATIFDVGDLSNWDTSRVTNMSGLFAEAGYSASSFDIGDLSNWDTSRVTNMYGMFAGTALSASSFDLGNLNNWNTSNVIDMSYIFAMSGKNATTWNIGNISNWNVSNVTTFAHSLAEAGYSATTFSLGDLSLWNTSNATDMSFMFSSTGYTATDWSLDLSGWNVTNVTAHDNFNTGVESKVTAPTWPS